MPVGALLALIAAVGYGASDFFAGMAGRRTPVMLVTAVTLGVELVFSGVVLVFVHGSGPTASVLLWGAISGVGSAVGTLALYQGFAVGSMSVVATVSGVLTVVIPAVVGVLIGNRLPVLGILGVIAAIVAVALVSWTGGSGAADGEQRQHRGGALYGIIAGASFALLFIALERAGSGSGAWPVASGMLVACVLIVPFAVAGFRARGGLLAAEWRLPLIAGVLGAVAALAYLASTGFGELVIIAVVTSMYPAVTVLLARFVLRERWNWPQRVGLVLSAASVAVVALA
ncbi:DMT family transporter [Planctomonas sp. JC2975]|uniref:EamA family transporter n=1 Tax=Planctomonas sp. JC2975 TaxID=2729626 RepID=UPI001475ABBC|nr:EamA family transporter [Planctomonas sp. JC2975]NNC11548.1 DMT family transporter [Planctomonas sp. JC2975]